MWLRVIRAPLHLTPVLRSLLVPLLSGAPAWRRHFFESELTITFSFHPTNFSVLSRKHESNLGLGASRRSSLIFSSRRVQRVSATSKEYGRKSRERQEQREGIIPLPRTNKVALQYVESQILYSIRFKRSTEGEILHLCQHENCPYLLSLCFWLYCTQYIGACLLP